MYATVYICVYCVGVYTHGMCLYSCSCCWRHIASNLLKLLVQFFFNVLLTVHLIIFILVINQLDAQKFCFTISLLYASTCFEHNVLIIRRSKLYYTASGIITPIGVMMVLETCRGMK